jgi:DNA-directed RNA polymerase subunit RPC12/RpoP
MDGTYKGKRTNLAGFVLLPLGSKSNVGKEVAHIRGMNTDSKCAKRVQDRGSTWILCPVCSGKTRIKARSDTVMLNFPLYCPKCGKETLVNIHKNQIDIIQEPDAKTQSR